MRAFAGKPGVTVGPGWGRGGIVLKRDGKIFAMLVRGEFVAKLPEARIDELVDRGIGVRFDPRRDGRVMKEWLVVERLRRGNGRAWPARRSRSARPRAEHRARLNAVSRPHPLG